MAGTFCLSGNAGEKIRDGLVEQGVLKSGGDFCERVQDEAAFVESGMGEGELGSLDDEVVTEEEIEVDDAGAFRGRGGAVATHGVLDGEEGMKQVDRGEAGFE